MSNCSDETKLAEYSYLTLHTIVGKCNTAFPPNIDPTERTQQNRIAPSLLIFNFNFGRVGPLDRESKWDG